MLVHIVILVLTTSFVATSGDADVIDNEEQLVRAKRDAPGNPYTHQVTYLKRMRLCLNLIEHVKKLILNITVLTFYSTAILYDSILNV